MPQKNIRRRELLKTGAAAAALATPALSALAQPAAAPRCRCTAVPKVS